MLQKLFFAHLVLELGGWWFSPCSSSMIFLAEVLLSLDHSLLAVREVDLQPCHLGYFFLELGVLDLCGDSPL